MKHPDISLSTRRIALRVTLLLRAKHFHDTRAVLEHLTAVEDNDDYCSHGKQEIIPGLGIWENGVHHVQVIKDGDQEAAARGVEQRRQDNSNRDESNEEGTNRPAALWCPTHEK